MRKNTRKKWKIRVKKYNDSEDECDKMRKILGKKNKELEEKWTYKWNWTQKRKILMKSEDLDKEINIIVKLNPIKLEK